MQVRWPYIFLFCRYVRIWTKDKYNFLMHNNELILKDNKMKNSIELLISAFRVQYEDRIQKTKQKLFLYLLYQSLPSLSGWSSSSSHVSSSINNSVWKEKTEWIYSSVDVLHYFESKLDFEQMKVWETIYPCWRKRERKRDL